MPSIARWLLSLLMLATLGGLVLAADGPAVRGKETPRKKPSFGGKPARDRVPDAPYVPTEQEVVDKMLELAEIRKGDIVCDLGCGDARSVVTAAKKYGCLAWGFDISPARVKDSLENVKRNKVEDLVTIEERDIFTLQLKDATVLFLYLFSEMNEKLIPQFKTMAPGSRIVAHDFGIPGVRPEKTIEGFRSKTRTHTIYLYRTPLVFEKK